ncbi:MAG: 50S ribosomal protein L15 [Chlamydiales bacterium]|nr:50S ribosomal protein L15 [Chlamydiales bacterium]
MFNLHTLKNTSKPYKRTKRVGRGVGSKMGKTSGRGEKGGKSRSGYKRRIGQEGGQAPLYTKLPTRGFTRGRWAKESVAINLGRIDAAYEDGETVNHATLIDKGLAPRLIPGGIKILGDGELTKKVVIEAHRYSKSALTKLEKSTAEYKTIKA